MLRLFIAVSKLENCNIHFFDVFLSGLEVPLDVVEHVAVDKVAQLTLLETLQLVQQQWVFTFSFLLRNELVLFDILGNCLYHFP